MQPNEAHSDEYNNGNKTRCESSGYRATFQLFPQGNTPGSSRAYPVDIPGPRKLEIRLLLILWAPERRVRRPPAQAICIFSSYWLFGLDARNGPITLLLCLDQAGSLAAQIWHLHRDLG